MQPHPVYGPLALEPYSRQLIINAIITLIVGFGLLVGCLFVPTRMRKPIVWTVTFLAGFFWVLFFIYPQPINRGPADIPRNAAEAFGFLLEDGTALEATITNSVGAFLFGLGIYSLLRIHIKQFVRLKKDWFFSMVLLVSMLAMVIFGYAQYFQEKHNPGVDFSDPAKWTFVNKGFNFMFEGLLQQMDAVMFSLIAFFILSAAYRAFRIRSVESTVLMASALLMMLTIMGAVDFAWSGVVKSMTHGDATSVLNNLELSRIAEWVKQYLQVPSLRALDFGIALGGLAMAIRIWLGLEKGGVSV